MISWRLVSKIHPLIELTNKNKIINFKQVLVTLTIKTDLDDLLQACNDHHYVHEPPRLRDRAVFQSPMYACGAGEWNLLNFR